MNYSTPLVWLGTWKTPAGLKLDGFHVWNRNGLWWGVYQTCSRAYHEARTSLSSQT